MSKQKRVKRTKPENTASPVPNLGRHEAQCSICAHAQVEDIERAFITWASPTAMAKRYGVSRDSIYRHAHAKELTGKRGRNLHAALEQIIERAGEVEVTAPAVVAAVQAYAKINSRGQWIERSESVNLNALFEKMSVAELDSYAKDGTLPSWFESAVGATQSNSREEVSR